MVLPPVDQLHDIASAARTLRDRLHCTGEPEQLVETLDPASLVDRWCETSARGNATLFAERIAALRRTGTGSTTTGSERCPGQGSQLESGTNPIHLALAERLPDWMAPLCEAAEPTDADGTATSAASMTVGTNRGEEGTDSTTVLATLIDPLVRCAKSRLLARWEPSPAVSPTVLLDLEASLRRYLASLLQTCADTEFAKYLDTLDSADRAAAWDTWIGRERETGLFGLWRTYPVLARLVGVAILNWVDRASDLLQRLVRDWNTIELVIAKARLSRATRVRTGLSDPHEGHATVAIVEFESNQGHTVRVVYKPRNQATELLWTAVVRWGNDHGLDLGPPLRIVLGDGYGWTEYAEHLPVADAPGVDRFYRRIGKVMALMHALGGTDLHWENVIARADQPVVIDAETVLQPAISGEDGAAGSPPGSGTDSVLDQSLLPRWLRIDQKAVDISALGAGSHRARHRSRLLWTDACTADARLVSRVISDSPDTGAAVILNSHAVRPEEHADQIQSGFREAWDLIAEHADSLLSGPLARIDRVEVRVLIRMTRAYARVLQTSMEPFLLRDGASRSIHLDHVARALLDRDDRSCSLTIADLEREQLENGDIPRFLASADATGLEDEIGRTALLFDESAAARTRRRIRTIADPSRGPVEFMRQSRYIAASLAVAPPRARLDIQLPSPGVQTVAPGFGRSGASTGPDTRLLHSVSESLAHQLAELIDPISGRLLSLVIASPEQWAIDEPGNGLYDGSAGIGLALLAAARILKQPELTERAVAIMAPGISDGLNRPHRIWATNGIGGQEGVGGILLAWSYAAEMAGDSRVRQRLLAALDSLVCAGQTSDIPPGVSHDLLDGSLGLLAGFMAARTVGVDIPRALRDSVVETVICSVASDLDAPGHALDRGLNGYCHGDSGTATILLGASQIGWIDAPAAGAMAEACVRRESKRFSESLGDWPDLRPGSDRSRPAAGWCNGMPGIALARYILRERFPDVAPRAVATDMKRIAANSKQLLRGQKGIDHLCCGTASYAESLRALALRDPRIFPAYSESVNRLAHRTESSTLRLGVPPTCPLPPVGLFRGISGVLVALLGAIDPAMPNILTWLPPKP